MRFLAYYMLPQVPSNEIFLDRIPHDISSLCVKYLTSGDIRWDFPMIGKNRYLQKQSKMSEIIHHSKA